MKTKERLIGGTVALIMLAVPCISSSALIDLSDGPLGKTGSPTATYAPGLEAHGLYLGPGNVWADADLFRRAEPNDNGLGVCNPDELIAFMSDPTCGGGNVNELDNADRAELITLMLPDGFTWVSVRVSSEDTDGGADNRVETSRLYADSDGVPNGTMSGSVGDTVIMDLSGGADVEQVVMIPAANATSPYLMFEPYDTSGGGSTDNDFLVYQATIIEIPSGGEGCTPGFWKQRHHFAAWVGYTPGQQFSSVFDDAFSGMTLRAVLKQGGGGLKALGRHTVAALLNAANSDVDYGKTTAEVIAAFNAVYDDGNGTKSEYNALKRVFASDNEEGCPINGKSAPSAS